MHAEFEPKLTAKSGIEMGVLSIPSNPKNPPHLNADRAMVKDRFSVVSDGAGKTWLARLASFKTVIGYYTAFMEAGIPAEDMLEEEARAIFTNGYTRAMDGIIEYIDKHPEAAPENRRDMDMAATVVAVVVIGRGENQKMVYTWAGDSRLEIKLPGQPIIKTQDQSTVEASEQLGFLSRQQAAVLYERLDNATAIDCNLAIMEGGSVISAKQPVPRNAYNRFPPVAIGPYISERSFLNNGIADRRLITFTPLPQYGVQPVGDHFAWAQMTDAYTDNTYANYRDMLLTQLCGHDCDIPTYLQKMYATARANMNIAKRKRIRGGPDDATIVAGRSHKK